jgi:hypothetical protein
MSEMDVSPSGIVGSSQQFDDLAANVSDVESDVTPLLDLGYAGDPSTDPFAAQYDTIMGGGLTSLISALSGTGHVVRGFGGYVATTGQLYGNADDESAEDADALYD